MSSIVLKRKILGVLLENITVNQHPGLVDSATIAEKVMVSEDEVKRTIRSMGPMGVIESDEENRRSLITREGILWLQRMGPSPCHLRVLRF